MISINKDQFEYDKFYLYLSYHSISHNSKEYLKSHSHSNLLSINKDQINFDQFHITQYPVMIPNRIFEITLRNVGHLSVNSTPSNLSCINKLLTKYCQGRSLIACLTIQLFFKIQDFYFWFQTIYLIKTDLIGGKPISKEFIGV